MVIIRNRISYLKNETNYLRCGNMIVITKPQSTQKSVHLQVSPVKCVSILFFLSVPSM